MIYNEIDFISNIQKRQIIYKLCLKIMSKSHKKYYNQKLIFTKHHHMKKNFKNRLNIMNKVDN